MLQFLSFLFYKIRQKFLQGKAIRNSVVDPSSRIQSGCQFINSKIGRHSYTAYNCQISDCEIGNFCSIAPEVLIGAAQHPINWASSSPAFEGVKNSSPKKRFAHFPPPESLRTAIGSDVWIGQRATIKGGVKIGHGAIIGAGAVVTKDVEPYAIVGGCPARLIRYRFDEDTRNLLLQSEWWNLKDEEIEKFAMKIQDPSEFAMEIIDYKIKTKPNPGGG